MKKVFYLFTVTIFLVACVFSSNEKDKGPEHGNVTSPAPETDDAPSPGNNMNVDTTVANDGHANSDATPTTTSGNPGSSDGKGSQAGKEMTVPPPTLDTVALH
jgi:hypothetical protein